MPQSARSGGPPPSPHKPDKAPKPQIVDERLAARCRMSGDNSTPVRTIIYLEVGNTPPDQAREILANVSDHYRTNEHPIFVIPVRNGKFTGDVLFEAEILDLVNKLCEVKDGQIVLRRGSIPVDVLRTCL